MNVSYGDKLTLPLSKKQVASKLLTGALKLCYRFSMRLIAKLTAFTLSFSAALLYLPHLFAATAINVPSSAYPTIQAGVNAATPGDTVNVSEGSYSENIVIGKNNVTLKGAGAGRTFLNLTTIGRTAVTFDNVSGSGITGFTIKKCKIGVLARKSKPIVTNNIFLGNTEAFRNSSSFSRVVNNVFYRNGKAVFSNSSATIRNNIIAGSGRYGFAGGKAGFIGYNLFWKNALRDYSGIPMPPPTFNNITGKLPLFANFTGDFHVRTGSPAINAGDPASSYNNVSDGKRNDMGAYGGPQADVVPALVGGVVIVSSTSKVTVGWSKNPAYNITGYRVYYRKPAEAYISTSFVAATDAASLDLMASNITANQRYYFAVTAIADGNNSHESPRSSEVAGAIDTIPPSVPVGSKADIGDKRLFLSWNAATDNESGVKGYNIYYGTASGGYSTPIDAGNTTSYELTGLVNGTRYYIAVSAYDYAGNEGIKSGEISQSPEEVRGILGLKGRGGCFIATAAYGSYEERHVKVLREFRDRYLLTNRAGRAFVSFYYMVSPPIADFIIEHRCLKPVVRVALWPVVAFSWLLMNYPLPIIIIGSLFTLCVALICFPRPAICFLIFLSFPAASLADEQKGLSVGFCYGQLEPASDRWKDIYGAERTTNFRLSMGYGFSRTFGAEIGAGYLQKDGRGKAVSGGESGVETAFQSAPVDITVVYRLDYLPKQLIVPHIGAGVSYNLYWEKIKDGRELKGGMWGHHATGGIRLLLDRFDKGSASGLEEGYGIKKTYLTIGATHSVINDFGREDVDLGGWNYQIGLVFDL